MFIDSTDGKRFDLALELFEKDGKSLEYRGLSVAVRDKRFLFWNRHFLHAAYPSSLPPDAVTEESARSDFKIAQEILAELVNSSRRFAQIVQGRSLKIDLYHGLDRGPGVQICSLIDGKIQWPR